jgi:hypothetical protein
MVKEKIRNLWEIIFSFLTVILGKVKAVSPKSN